MVIVLVIAASIVRFIVTDSAIEWHIIGQYLFNSLILKGAVATLYLSVLAMLMGVILGVILAIMRLSPNPILKSTSWLYIFLFRGTPLLVQVVFWYNIAALFPGVNHEISLGIPFGPGLVSPDANKLITVFVAALLALGVNEGAYMAEIVRAGIISVPEGQSEAARLAGPGSPPDHAPDRAAAGDARDPAADRQRVHLDAEEHLARRGDRLPRALLPGTVDL